MKRLLRANSLISQPQRSIRSFLSRGKGCTHNDLATQHLQSLLEGRLPKIESLFPQATSLNFLLQVLFLCQEVGIRDKFFYDSLVGQIDSRLEEAREGWQMKLLSQCLARGERWREDWAQLGAKLYAMCYERRAVLTEEQKKDLARMFQAMEMHKVNDGKHLDLFQGQSKKQLRTSQSEIFQLDFPPQFQLSFDVEHHLALLKNSASQQLLLLFGSEHYLPESINFGKQLLRTFNPKTILLEQSPLQELVQAAQLKEDGFIHPAKFSQVSHLLGNDIHHFVRFLYLESPAEFHVDSKEHTISQGGSADGSLGGRRPLVPLDMPTYAYYHSLLGQGKVQSKSPPGIQHNPDANSNGERKIVLADLTQQEKAVGMLEWEGSLGQLKKEVEALNLLEVAAWMKATQGEGCFSCASFFKRQEIAMFPRRPIELVSNQSMPQFKIREKNIAHEIISTALHHPSEPHLLAFIGRDHLLGVLSHMSGFLNDHQSFQSYRRPGEAIDRELSAEERNSMLKRLAFDFGMQEENVNEDTQVPFKHKPNERHYLKLQELKFLRKATMIDLVGDLDDFELEFEKGDFQKEKVNRDGSEEGKLLDQFLEKAGGKLKCGTLGYWQGNFAYYHIEKQKFVNECMKDVEVLAKGYPEQLDLETDEEILE